jgi:TolA-binding protein
MATLENVKLLEAKVAKALEFVRQLTEANNQLVEENKQLREKLTANQNQINELEFLILGFKEDQQNIETSILSAIDRLNQFEDTIGKSPVPSEVSAPVQTYGNAAGTNNVGNNTGSVEYHDNGYQGNGYQPPSNYPS